MVHEQATDQLGPEQVRHSATRRSGRLLGMTKKGVNDKDAHVLQIDCSAWCSRSCRTSCGPCISADLALRPRPVAVTISNRSSGKLATLSPITCRGQAGSIGRPGRADNPVTCRTGIAEIRVLDLGGVRLSARTGELHIMGNGENNNGEKFRPYFHGRLGGQVPG